MRQTSAESWSRAPPEAGRRTYKETIPVESAQTGRRLPDDDPDVEIERDVLRTPVVVPDLR